VALRVVTANRTARTDRDREFAMIDPVTTRADLIERVAGYEGARRAPGRSFEEWPFWPGRPRVDPDISSRAAAHNPDRYLRPSRQRRRQALTWARASYTEDLVPSASSAK
jgi:hypothetical protein